LAVEEGLSNSMLKKITFVWRRRAMMRAVFKCQKSHSMKESTNLNFATPEERIKEQQAEATPRPILFPFKKGRANDKSGFLKRLFRQQELPGRQD
jgi:hypothetical protein